MLEDEMMILRRVDTGFEKWLCGLPEVELEKVVRRAMKGHGNEVNFPMHRVCEEHGGNGEVLQ